MNKEKRVAIFERFKAQNPEPKTELEYNSHFELLAAVLLSAQATDKGVNLATRRLFATANTPEQIAALGTTGVEAYIKTIGLFRSKAKHLVETAIILRDQYHSTVPNTREDLERLPGVGRKTANVVLNTAFGQPTMAVDTHIFRVSNRIGLAKGKTVLEVEHQLLKSIPKEYMQHAHHWLILHGRYICKARKPSCNQCSIEDLCEFKQKIL